MRWCPAAPPANRRPSATRSTCGWWRSASRRRGGRVPVIAGAGSNSTAEAIPLTRHAKEAGADAALVVTPYYNKPTQEGQYRHFKAIPDAVDMPIIIYNIPGRTIVDMSRRDHGAPRQAAEHRRREGCDRTIWPGRCAPSSPCGRNSAMLSGEDATALAYLAQGGHGCISVTRQCRAAPLRRYAERLARRATSRPRWRSRSG